MPTKRCTMLGHLLGRYTIYTFSGALAPLMEYVSALQFDLCNLVEWSKEWQMLTNVELCIWDIIIN